MRAARTLVPALAWTLARAWAALRQPWTCAAPWRCSQRAACSCPQEARRQTRVTWYTVRPCIHRFLVPRHCASLGSTQVRYLAQAGWHVTAAAPARAAAATGAPAVHAEGDHSPGRSPGAKLLMLKRQQARPRCAIALQCLYTKVVLLVSGHGKLRRTILQLGHDAECMCGHVVPILASSLNPDTLDPGAQETRRAMSAGAAARRPPPGQQGTPGALTLTPALQPQPFAASVDALPRATSALAAARGGAAAEALTDWLGRLSPVRPIWPRTALPPHDSHVTTGLNYTQKDSWTGDVCITL